MDIFQKLHILARAAQYDVSCSSSGSQRKNTPTGLGNTRYAGICHSWAADGRCISLLKVLFSNDCVYDCAYCVSKRSNDIERATFSVQEIIDLTLNFYKRNYIEGLFLSSGVYKNPDYTMELLLETVKRLRINHQFNGYIHLKAIPGASLDLIRKAGLYADRMSVNIEFPSEAGLKLLAPQKTKESILKPMAYLGKTIPALGIERKKFKKAPLFVPAGQTTQMVIGATNESDWQILKLTQHLYTQFSLKRVYFSAFVPVMKDKNLPALLNPPLKREHRLYQADWLLRFYGFKANEILDHNHPHFNMDFDPKTDWALRNYHLFPVEINKVSYEMLLRIPGIGVKSAQRIMRFRRIKNLNFEDLKKIGVVLKRAQFFILCLGKTLGTLPEPYHIYHKLKEKPKDLTPSLFSFAF